MKNSYAQFKDEEPINWHERLDKLISFKDTFFDIYEDRYYQESCDLARNWVTCACGNQCSVIPRYEDGTPKNEYLKLLGIEFHRYISIYSFHKAKEILQTIEEFSAFLINETEKQTRLS